MAVTTFTMNIPVSDRAKRWCSTYMSRKACPNLGPALESSVPTMNEFKGETFRGLFDRGDKLRIEEMRFTECIFEGCGLSMTVDIWKMSEVRAVELVNCSINRCETGPMIVSDVTVSDLKTK